MKGLCIMKTFRKQSRQSRPQPELRKNRFTLIELLVVIAMIAILLRSKWLFFLLFSAFFTFLHFHEKTLNTQIQNVTFCMIAG